MGGRLSRREVVPQSEVTRDGLYKYPTSDGRSHHSLCPWSGVATVVSDCSQMKFGSCSCRFKGSMSVVTCPVGLL